MCLTEPGRVIEVEDGMALIAVGSGRKRALTLLVPDVRAGEQVVIGAGAIVRRIEEAEAEALRRAYHVAMGDIDRAAETE
jgi:hydrogenase maturation factor